MSTQDVAVAACHSVEPDRWLAELDDLFGRIAGRFARVEPRRRARGFVLGLLADLPRKNCWSVAEHAGDAGPRGMQRLLSAAVWDHDGVLADVRDYVVERLGDTDAVLVVDETGDLKKGAATVGVHRQYTGTAGKVDNAQVAVYLAYASPGGCAFIDRALYLPRAWTDDHDRCAAAGVPDEVGFVTKPQLATRMIARALDAGVPAQWVAGDEVYGADPGLRAELAGRGVGYVLAVAKDHRISTAAGTLPAADWARMLPRQAWQPLSAGHGAKGHRVYNWALIDTSDPAATSGCHWLLIRRHRRTGELAFYRCHAPTPVPLSTLVRVAGTRWKIEESFQTGKDLAGLDEHQVRGWISWHRWTALALLAHAFLSVLATTQRQPSPDQQLIPLTRNEIRRLLAALISTIRHATHILRWSAWRRRHQAQARAAHYRHQAALTWGLSG